jgi:hypothetical protein
MEGATGCRYTMRAAAIAAGHDERDRQERLAADELD